MSLEVLDEVIEGGEVHFRGRSDDLIHRFVLTKQAIEKLSCNKNINLDQESAVLEVFRQHQSNIAKVAENLLIKKDLAYDPVYTITATMI